MSAGAAPPPERERRCDQVRARLARVVDRSETPGLQYVAIDRDTTVLEHCGGLADVATGRPMTPATTMMAYSMSKTVTAVAALQLVERGELELDEPVDRHGAPQPYGAITVRQLLSHTSGAPNPLPLRWVHPAAAHRGFDGDAALAAVLARHARPAFPPGERYGYSNIGYWLLGRIVERASGRRFPEQVEREVLARLGSAAGGVAYEIAGGGDHASGYLAAFSALNLIKRLVVDRELIGGREGRWVRILDHCVDGAAFGGLVGTARGFAALLQDQLRERSALLGEATRALLYEPARTRRGEVVAMTLGWHVDDSGPERCYFKEGGGGGFHSIMRLYPASGLGTVAMANAASFDVKRLAAIDRVLLA